MKPTASHMRRRTKLLVCVTATWSGYNSGQRREVHREYFMIPNEELEAFINRAHEPHQFTDGTCNWYHVAPVITLRDLPPEHLGYKELVRERFFPTVVEAGA